MTTHVIRASNSHRRRVSAATGDLALQSYLLNHDNYTATYGNLFKPTGREFSLASTGDCYGLRNKCSTITTVHIRLWRVSDEALLATKNALPVVVGENILLFDSPVSLATGSLYRIVAIANALTTNMINQALVDHPDGPVVTLTSNTFLYQHADIYPTVLVANWSTALEPIIYA